MLILGCLVVSLKAFLINDTRKTISLYSLLATARAEIFFYTFLQRSFFDSLQSFSLFNISIVVCGVLRQCVE